MSDEQLPQGVTTAPERTWLQVGTDDWHLNEPFPEYGEGVTWCHEPCTAAEVEYVRADLAAPVEITDEMAQRAAASLRRTMALGSQPTDDDMRAALRAALGVK